MSVRILLVIIMVAVIASCENKQSAANEMNLTDETDSISYYTGIYTACNVRSLDVKELNTKAFYAGVQEAFEEKPEISKEDASYNITWFFDKLSKKQLQRNLAKGRIFLEQNKTRKEVQTASSGLQYEVIRKGSGIKPGQTDSVLLDFTGTLMDGAIFASSEGKPQAFFMNEKDEMKGWAEALTLMDVGSKYKFYLPTELAFGNTPPPLKGLKPNVPVIFEIELISKIENKRRK